MDQNLNEISEAELAEWQYAHRDELDAEEGELVDVEISPQLSVTMSFRLPGAEADAIREAARSAGTSLSEWIRQACADALDREDRRRRQVEAQLERVLRQLDAARKQLEAAVRTNLGILKEPRSKRAKGKSARASATSRRSAGRSSDE